MLAIFENLVIILTFIYYLFCVVDSFDKQSTACHTGLGLLVLDYICFLTVNLQLLTAFYLKGIYFKFEFFDKNASFNFY